MMIPTSMVAITIKGGVGPAEALEPGRVETPVPGRGEVLIRVRAAGVNRPDIFQRMGLYPPPVGASSILGLEVAGEVVAVGPDAGRWQLGDRVMALLNGGGYAEFAVADIGSTMHIPSQLNDEQAAALPETLFTVYANMFEHGALKAGERILIHGATSGIGVMAIQMAKAAGAYVMTTSRGADKAAKALEMGADVSIDASCEDFAEVVQSHGGVDVIVDMVAGSYFAKNIKALNQRGRLVHIAFQGGAKVELDVVQLMQKQLIITGSTLRTRSASEKARLASAIEQTVGPWLASGLVRPVIDHVFPLADAALAHSRLEQGNHVGKIVLTI
jgi:putative PIG3 family NAD(P)H quinone oxidoreductase